MADDHNGVASFLVELGHFANNNDVMMMMTQGMVGENDGEQGGMVGMMRNDGNGDYRSSPPQSTNLSHLINPDNMAPSLIYLSTVPYHFSHSAEATMLSSGEQDEV